jgi:hypothetical protein
VGELGQAGVEKPAAGIGLEGWIIHKQMFETFVCGRQEAER